MYPETEEWDWNDMPLEFGEIELELRYGYQASSSHLQLKEK